MNGQTKMQAKQSQIKEGSSNIDIIKQTRKLVVGLTEEQRFQKAKNYLNDALRYKTPRLDTHQNSAGLLFKVCYTVQTSEIWKMLLIALCYILMYSIILRDEKVVELSISLSILCILWVDLGMEVYHKRFEILRISSRFQTRFYIKIVVLLILVADQLMFAFASPETVKPLVIFRCTLPIIYDLTTRKSFEALRNSYKDIIVYVAFYTIVILSFAIVANQIIEIPEGTEYDRFTENYTDLGKCFFIIYVLSSYESYPDNQLVAIRQSMWIYLFFICFILLNLLFFITIPTTILFNSFRQTRSKMILIDQIKQQHSLIMSFVCLGQQDLNIPQQKFIKFLLYVYKKKVRYVDYITEVCLKVDQNNNGQIHVNEYMQLCKILQANSSMMPPRFEDWDKWMRFREFLKKKLKLKKIVLSKPFRIFVSIFIILTFVNCCLALYQGSQVFFIIDNVIIVISCIEILVKMLGLGPQNFFRDTWNKLQFFIVLFGAIIELIPSGVTAKNSDILFKMPRIFRINMLIEVFSRTRKIAIHTDIYMRSKKLLSQIVIIIPIVLKFLPFYLISSYALGVLGMQIFRNDTNSTDSDYGDYNQYSNFTNFLGSQFIFLQILVEAGWETIAYHHADRYGLFTLTMLFFIISHIFMVIVLSSVMKGLAWEVYSTVQEEFEERKNETLKYEQRSMAIMMKKQQFSRVKQKIRQHELLLPDNLITRQIYETKINQQIFKKIKDMLQLMQSSINSNKDKRNRRGFISNLMENNNIFLHEIEINSDGQEKENTHHEIVLMSKLLDHVNLGEIQDIEEEDIEEAMEKVLSKVLLHPNIKFTQAIVYPKPFVDFLQNKFKISKQQCQEDGDSFDLNSDGLANQKSLKFHTYEIQTLLGIENSEREQKALIIKNMVAQKIISGEHEAKILTKHFREKDRSIQSNWVMRKMFLSDTNEQLIKKFQIEYFSNIYGKSFRQINKVTIQPLLQLQTRVTYCLRNALRYRNVETKHFFIIISQIEEIISNKLLKRGSLFKFVFQLDSISDTWFSVDLKENYQIKINFIKTGLWIYNKSMLPNQIKVAKDLFNWDFTNRHNQKSCERYIKLFFQGFQTLAFSLQKSQAFFKQDPKKNIYDLFTFFRDVQDVKRFNMQKLTVSKIMPVILSLEEQRQQQILPYSLTDLKVQNMEGEKKQDFLFKMDESENETFKKLKKIELLDHQKIIETQGLPYTYILNFLNEIMEILQFHEHNMVYHVEKVLNHEFNSLL